MWAAKVRLADLVKGPLLVALGEPGSVAGAAGTHVSMAMVPGGVAQRIILESTTSNEETDLPVTTVSESGGSTSSNRASV